MLTQINRQHKIKMDGTATQYQFKGGAMYVCTHT
jgi:hypothetical protein